MKLEDMKKREVKKAAELGQHEVTFESLRYWEDKETAEIKGCFIKVKEFKDIFIPIYDDNTIQLDYILEQMGCDSYIPEEINILSGCKIKVTMKRSKNGKFINADFNPDAKYDANEKLAVDFA